MAVDQNTFPSIQSSQWFPGGDDQGRQQQRLDTIVGDHVVQIVQIAVVTIFCGIICTLGLVANVINVIVFLRQGALSSSSNVSLLVLAFADLGSLAPVLCNSINHALVYLGHAGVFLTPIDFMNTAIIWPHIMCIQVASWITAYIAFERCICVLFPLKVKSIFSAKRSVFVTAGISFIIIVSFIPTFATQGIANLFDPYTNTTRVVFMPTELHIEIVETSDTVHALILRPVALLVVFVCTHVTMYRVKLSASWRKSITMTSSSTTTTTTTSPPTTTTTPGDSSVKNSDETDTVSNKGQSSRVVMASENKPRDTTSLTQDTSLTSKTGPVKARGSNPRTNNASSTKTISKETRLIKMIAIICVIFMVCNAPDIVGVFVLKHLQSTLQLSLDDNLFSLIIAAQLCLESLHSAVNIIVYYKMSTTYRQTFRALMGMTSKEA